MIKFVRARVCSAYVYLMTHKLWYIQCDLVGFLSSEVVGACLYRFYGTLLLLWSINSGSLVELSVFGWVIMTGLGCYVGIGSEVIWCGDISLYEWPTNIDYYYALGGIQ